MEQNNENQNQDWLQKLKEGLNNPDSNIWKENKKFSLDDEIEIEGQKKYEKVEMTPEWQELLNKSKLERLQDKTRFDKERLEMIEKVKVENEKKRKALVRKQNASIKANEKIVKEFDKAIKGKGFKGFDNLTINKEFNLAISYTKRIMTNVFDSEGDFLFSVDELGFGHDGLLYVIENNIGLFRIYHFDIVTKKLELIADYNSFLDMKIAVYKKDQDKMLGFDFKLPYYKKDEIDEEIRKSKLTKEELEAEERDKQEQIELKKAQQAKLKSAIDDEFEKLFGD